jgi:hypothetical protein
MTKDYLGRELGLGDFVVFMRPRYREFALGNIVKFTPTGMARIKFGESSWQNILQGGAQLVKVEGAELSVLLLKQKH